MQTQLFGILNITPDSFFDGGKFETQKSALDQAKKIIDQGAEYIDVGACSTNPKSQEIESTLEWKRLENILPILIKNFGGEKISLDSFSPFVAEKYLRLGGKILNDVSGFQNQEMIQLAVKFQPKVIINHFPGKTIAEVHEQKIDSEKKVLNNLLRKSTNLINAGVKKENIILDPGIGFGKTIALNQKLLKFAKNFSNPEKEPSSEEKINFPVMIGFSRKRFLGKNRFKKEINQSAAKTSIYSGAQYLRVHEIDWYREL